MRLAVLGRRFAKEGRCPCTLRLVLTNGAELGRLDLVAVFDLYNDEALSALLYHHTNNAPVGIKLTNARVHALRKIIHHLAFVSHDREQYLYRRQNFKVVCRFKLKRAHLSYSKQTLS